MNLVDDDGKCGADRTFYPISIASRPPSSARPLQPTLFTLDPAGAAARFSPPASVRLLQSVRPLHLQPARFSPPASPCPLQSARFSSLASVCARFSPPASVCARFSPPLSHLLREVKASAGVGWGFGCCCSPLRSGFVRVAFAALARSLSRSVPHPPSLGCAVLRVSPAELVRVIVSAELRRRCTAVMRSLVPLRGCARSVGLCPVLARAVRPPVLL